MIYVIMMGKGEYDSYLEDPIFASLSKDVAEKKINALIKTEENKKRAFCEYNSFADGLDAIIPNVTTYSPDFDLVAIEMQNKKKKMISDKYNELISKYELDSISAYDDFASYRLMEVESD